jgi:hypothetical protein
LTHRGCEVFQELASALADDRLDAADIPEFQGHLKECAECRLFLNDIYRVRDLIRTAEARQSSRTPSPPAFATAVSRRLEGELLFPAPPAVSEAPVLPVWKRFSGVAAAAVLLLAVGWSWHRLTPPELEMPVAATQPAVQENEEGSVASYFRQHALQTMDATLLGPPEGIELASFETFAATFE